MNPLAYALIGSLVFWSVLLIALPGLAVFTLACGLLLVLVLWAAAETLGLSDPDNDDR